MQNRRNFLKQASLLLAGGLVVPKILTSCNIEKTKQVGLQLYSLREMINEAGIGEALGVAAKIGYTKLEAANYDNGMIYGMRPAELKKRIGDLGMQCTSAHLGQAFTRENEAEVMAWWDKAIEAHRELGVTYMVQPWMPVSEQTTLDDLKMYCDYFNAVGEKAAAAGIGFGYHNHKFEFNRVDGQVIYDFLLQNTDKRNVLFELDVYWCQEGGGNPVAYLADCADRIKLVHIKDEKEIGASGKMNFEPIFNQMNANGIRDWYVEVEEFTGNDAVGGLRQSFDFLDKAAYVK
ncbi:MAG: sugar phosphate isomerase/epimerase [Parabacteroides sp.]|nr:sugar phosphate isomerase/epimerase [Parabacteroides sp.]